MATHHENHRHDSGDNREPARTSEVAGLQYRSGAFQAPSVRTKSPTVHSATPPKPPKGRFFVVGLVMSVLGFGAFNVWNSFFRYSAYGVVEGRTIEVPAPVTGVVRYVHVQNGDRVRQGQLLMTLDQHEIEQRLGRLGDELLMTQAKMDAEVSASQWRMAQYQIQFGEAAAEYRDKWAAVRADQVKLRRAQQRRERVQGMVAKKTATEDDLEQAIADEQSQRDRLETLLEGLVSWQQRSQVAELASRAGFDALQPMLAQLKNLESEQSRLREQLALGEIHSPVNGIVLNRHRFGGEGAEHLQSLVTILEEDSLEIVLYVPQQRLKEFQNGNTVHVSLPPFQDQLPCRITRMGDEHVTLPTQIQRHYPHQSKTVPIHLQPVDGRFQHERLQVGAVVQVPHDVNRWLGHMPPSGAPSLQEANAANSSRR